MKVDVLALGMLSYMKRGFDVLAEHKGMALDLATIPAEDPMTYTMIRKADTLSVFPDREPRPDGHAAADQAAHLL